MEVYIAIIAMLAHPPLHWAQSLPNASVYLERGRKTSKLVIGAKCVYSSA
jgi:hypothetical protein